MKGPAVKTLSSLAAAVIVSIALVDATTTSASAANAPALSWSSCGGGFQCATVSVPVDYNHPAGAHLGIALVRLPASDPAHRIGSLFVNPGGPGGSGIDVVRAEATALYPATVRARFDIVGFDPRGVGASRPVQCYATNDQENANFQGAPYTPLTPAETRRVIDADLRFDEACASRNGAFLEHMSTANAARDLDRLRLAVGDRAGLTYDGASYGSFLGETYANMFPTHVRALVIDGVVDPDAWVHPQPGEMALGVWGRGGYAEASADAMQQFLHLCAQAGAGCDFAAGALPLPQKWVGLLDRLKKHPTTVHYPGGDYTWTYSNLVQVVSGYLYEPAWFPALGQLLQPIWDATEQLHAAVSHPRLSTAVLGTYDNSFDANNAVACVDSDNPRDPWAIARSAAHSQRAVPDFGPNWAYFSIPCATWPARDADRYTGPFTRRTAHPVLVVGNTHDAAAPYRNAQKVAATMPGARLLTLDAVGHTSWDVGSQCIQRATAAYWISGTLPPAGTICQPDQRPFANTTDTPTAATVSPETFPGQRGRTTSHRYLDTRPDLR
jgi:pimeloyl-ACP methyl ester carboxylesterase